ncbi:Peptidase family M23 [Plantibacter sp. VKM Ac-1784]|uniref:Peptidase family M23 n=1 Tax=Plantibacter elymi (nom. nud.) TaxID=199708 RepID=A0ABY1RG66_9MICO|nr:M23 family metallopeptidase [Plantibacter sp. VKM Ac-1784]SMQ73330.1 Peptidase family M23 [Plantibacter sp. VKM Ac-1784]
MVLKYQQPFAQTDQATDGWNSWAGGRKQAHRGVDYQPGANASIPAVATGTVSYNDWNSALGHVLVIAHPDGMYSGYSHMRDPSPHSLGAAITRGQHVGYVGSTGTASKAPHLHLTITYTADGTWNNGDINVTVDPYAFINARLNGDDPGNTGGPSAPTQEELDDMAANRDAAIVRDYETEKTTGKVRTALLYPGGQAVALTDKTDINSAVRAHVVIYGLSPTNTEFQDPRDRFGAQVTAAQWTAFWKSYPGTKTGDFS